MGVRCPELLQIAPIYPRRPLTGIVSWSDERLAHSPGNLVHASKHCPMTGLLVYKQTLNGGWMELKSDSIEPNASTPSRSPYSAFRQQLSPALSPSHCSRGVVGMEKATLCSSFFLLQPSALICLSDACDVLPPRQRVALLSEIVYLFQHISGCLQCVIECYNTNWSHLMSSDFLSNAKLIAGSQTLVSALVDFDKSGDVPFYLSCPSCSGFSSRRRYMLTYELLNMF